MQNYPQGFRRRNGKIAEWLRVENGLHIGDLLEKGYALRKAETGAWYGETEQTVGNVTVQQAPITSVTLTALNADGTDASTSHTLWHNKRHQAVRKL